MRLLFATAAAILLFVPETGFSQTSTAQPVSQSANNSLFGMGFAGRLGLFEIGSPDGPVDKKRFQADKDFLASRAHSWSDLVTLAKKCRRLIGPPSYCEIPAMQQLAWTPRDKEARVR